MRAQPFGLGSLLGLVAPADAARSDGGGADAVASPGAAAAAAAAIPGLRALDVASFPLAGGEARGGCAGPGGARAVTTVLRGLDEVARHRQRSVAHVAFVLDCGEAEAAELLTQCSWDEPAAIDSYHARHAGTYLGSVTLLFHSRLHRFPHAAQAEGAAACVLAACWVRTQKRSTGRH